MRVIIDIEPRYFELVQQAVQRGDRLFAYNIIASGLVIPDDFLKNCDLKKLMELSTTHYVDNFSLNRGIMKNGKRKENKDFRC